jgi:acyl dehydratase
MLTSPPPHAHGLSLGTEITTAALTVTEAHVVAWASLTGDWLGIHTNAVAAASGQFGERIAHGPLTMALALGLVTQQRVFDDVVLAWLGVDAVRAQAPVRFGDTIDVVATVKELRPSRTSGRDVCTLDYSIRNQDGETVLTFVNALLLRAAEPAAAGGEPSR